MEPALDSLLPILAGAPNGFWAGLLVMPESFNAPWNRFGPSLTVVLEAKTGDDSPICGTGGIP